jgi:hypothetical protein
VRVIKTLVTLAHSLNDFRKAVRVNRKVIVKLVARARSQVGLKRVLHFFDISVPTFRQWSIDSQTTCFESLTGLCNRIYPAQLSRPEVVKLKHLLADPRFQYWPVSSIAFHALPALARVLALRQAKRGLVP